MKVLVLILLSVVAFFFVISNILAYTDFLAQLNYDKTTIKLVRISSALVLICSIIANANYTYQLNKNDKKKKIQLQIGLFLFLMMLSKVLTSYYVSYHSLKIWNDFTVSGKIKAENRTTDAMRAYLMYGKTIEYYDLNRTKRKYEPSKEYIDMYRKKGLLVEELYRMPFYITAIFLLLILSYTGSSKLAERTANKRKHNKYEETNSLP